MTFTQTQYMLWTGQTDNHNATEWAEIVNVASVRLASFLCLQNGLPTDPNSDQGYLPSDLQELLANFIASIFATQGASGEVTSKHVRNFTINFKSNGLANAYARIAGNYGDIIDFYSNCGVGFAVEGNANYCCDKGCACHE